MGLTLTEMEKAIGKVSGVETGNSILDMSSLEYLIDFNSMY